MNGSLARMRNQPKRLAWMAGLILAGAVVGAGVATAPVLTKQGLNHHVTTHTLPLYVKWLDFLDRHEQYNLLARDITRGLATDQDRVLAVFAWTRQHILKTPAGWPIVDDHVWHIIVRGHGVEDQMADVFTTLTTYAGVPAFWKALHVNGRTGGVVFSFAKIEKRWVVVDVPRGLVFRNARDELAGVDELMAHPEIVTSIAGAIRPGGLPYQFYVNALEPFEAPRPSRAELQMPGPRFWYETRRVLGVIKPSSVVPLFETLGPVDGDVPTSTRS